jgi:diguanylate cyclase (GGDEF)-like protein
VKKILIVLVAGIAVGATYWAMLIAQGADASVGTDTIARIALPGFASALIMAAYMAWEVANNRQTKGTVSELSAQLVRKEIEIDRLSTLDELTGLYTRHHFDENVQLEFKRAGRYKRPLSLLLIEIDDLLDLGEHVGKLSKGYLLSEVGAILRTMLRANDIGCRYTNETLAALLPETNGAQAMVVADKVRSEVAHHEFLSQRHAEGMRLTVSQGVAVVPVPSIETHAAFVKAAESALAEARASGFDQVRMHFTSPEPADETPDAERLAS